MLYHLKIWQKTIDFNRKYILVVFSIVVFLFIHGYLLLRLEAEGFYRQAKRYISRLEQLDRDLLIKRAYLYDKAFCFFKKATLFNPLNSRYYFDYAKLLLNILQEEDILDLVKINDMKDNIVILTNTQHFIIKAIRLEPLNSEYHLCLGYFYTLKSDNRNVEKEFKNAYILDSHNINNIIYITKYFLNKKLFDRALYYLDKVEFICKQIYYSFDSCKDILQLKDEIP